MKICPNCKAQNADQSGFCTSCGTPLSGSAPTPSGQPGSYPSQQSSSNVPPAGSWSNNQPAGHPPLSSPQEYNTSYRDDGAYSEADDLTTNIDGYNPYGSSGFGPGGPGGYDPNGFNPNQFNRQPKKSNSGTKIAIWIAVCVVIAIVVGLGVWFGLSAMNKKDDSSSSSVADSSSTVVSDSTISDTPIKPSESPLIEIPASSDTADSSEKESETSSSAPKPEKKDEPIEYRTNYVMKIRNGPGLEYERVGRLDEGDRVTITEVKEANDGSKWGKIGSEKWVCISDREMTYLSKVN